MSKILLTGATGYVGGTVLSELLANTAPQLKSLTLDLLVRNESQAIILKKAYGHRINTIIWQGLHDTIFIEQLAANYDIIINTGSGFIAEGAVAFVNGLAQRVAKDKPAPWMLHISGCTNLADRPLSQPSVPCREWNDARDGSRIYEHMTLLDSQDPYPQRTTELRVLQTASVTGVQAISVNTPCIFGEGSGLFNRQGLVVPLVMMYVLQHGYGFRLSDTANFDRVHVLDLAEIYVRLVQTILERPDRGVGYIPTGHHGILFAEAGRVLIEEINQRCLDVAFSDGVLPRKGTPKEKETRLVSLREIADEITAGQIDIAERGWAGHKATKAVYAREILGWCPQRLEDAWQTTFLDELVAVKEGRRKLTMEGCIGTTQIS
ncbi:similar to NAD dependent epimerase/dehydratase family protein [Plenodomus lingam JN3]|uniref:Similar to NAD dependent epimerase/dehydratase family protein n=1 Tax=Leptosphaeria maculans (strain JN3 / isolate v23.1.3 / race Av1-4-5-6-7-8) TaxID=985895 RepID=E5A4J4_LEPMJ|nr:similar to NAD dependent epimerase/dehydratase family protein [Plenodomus lingam JN3]CBX98542.1 similar to NAD dependent epimerase/dehydratase family protein [Plenodomus lingam JN3]